MISLKYAVLSTKQKMETLNFPVSFLAYRFVPSFSLVESSLKLTFGTGILDFNLSCFTLGIFFSFCPREDNKIMVTGNLDFLAQCQQKGHSRVF